MPTDYPLSQEIEITIPPSEPFYPPFVAGRDQEFAGRGPFVTVLVTLWKIGTNQLGYQISMDALETHDDFTFFQGQTGLKPIYNVNHQHPGFFIATILSDTASGVRLFDSDPHLNILRPSYGNLVREFTIEGDRKGDDQPWVQVAFNPVRIRIVESPHCFLKRINK
ncbi:MAG: hypothetical protein ACFE89_11365 [Candidatus Hodarchaeota archaeon]